MIDAESEPTPCDCPACKRLADFLEEDVQARHRLEEVARSVREAAQAVDARHGLNAAPRAEEVRQ